MELVIQRTPTAIGVPGRLGLSLPTKSVQRILGVLARVPLEVAVGVRFLAVGHAMTPHERAQAIDSLANTGRPSKVDRARELVRAWDLYTQSGAPDDPGYQAAAHALGEGEARQTHATQLAAPLLAQVHELAGVLVWPGGVGSGRSYAACRMLWALARRCAAGARLPMGRWVDAPELSGPAQWPRKGSTDPTWPEYRRTLVAPTLLILDDLGAEGTTGDGLDRARDLIQARVRAGRLTVVTTNVTDEGSLAQLLGGRTHSRAQVTQVRGADLRAGKLAPKPRPPETIVLARGIIRAAGDLERALREPWVLGQHPEGERAAAFIESDMSAELDPERWAATLEAELETMAERLAGIQSALQRVVDDQASRLATVEGADPLAIVERLKRADERARREHGEKLARLAAGAKA